MGAFASIRNLPDDSNITRRGKNLLNVRTFVPSLDSTISHPSSAGKIRRLGNETTYG